MKLKEKIIQSEIKELLVQVKRCPICDRRVPWFKRKAYASYDGSSNYVVMTAKCNKCHVEWRSDDIKYKSASNFSIIYFMPGGPRLKYWGEGKDTLPLYKQLKSKSKQQRVEKKWRENYHNTEDKDLDLKLFLNCYKDEDTGKYQIYISEESSSGYKKTVNSTNDIVETLIDYLETQI